MTIVRNQQTGVYEGDFRGAHLKRLHLTFRTKVRAKAEPLHAAVLALYREGDAEIVDLLRAGKITVEQVARCVRDRAPFSSLRPGAAWPTVAEACDAYTAWLTGNAKKTAKTAANARQQLAHWRDAFAERPLDRVPRAEAEAWQERIVTTKAAGTARNIVGRVVACYAWHARREDDAAHEQRRPARTLRCPLDAETRPTSAGKRERYLTPEEADRLTLATPPALAAAVACGLLAGLRIDEVCHLRPGVDVDFARDMLVVQARGTKGQPGFWQPKGAIRKDNAARREVPISPELRRVLERHLADGYASEAWLFPAATVAGPVSDAVLRDRFARVVRDAGLVYGRTDPTGVVFHTLRHTFASWLIAADVNPYRVAKMLGNTLAIVEDVYGHLAPSDNRAAVALVSSAVRFAGVTDGASA